MAEFNWETDPIVDFIAYELIAENEQKLLDLWRQARFELYEAGEDWGRTQVGLRVYLAQDLFREIRNIRERLQARLKVLGEPCFDGFNDADFSYVHIVCIVEADSSWRTGTERPVRVIEVETDKIWKNGYLRLFISHRSNQKEWLTKVKAELLAYGIDSFLAHQEIRATKKWRDMIQQGLQSCHSILTVCTDGFNASSWCNQEIGWGLARGVLVFPLLAGEQPIGFHAEHQGPTVGDDNAFVVALKIAKALCEDSRTNRLIYQGILKRIEEAGSWEDLKKIGNNLRDLSDCESDLLLEIESAFRKHSKWQGLFAQGRIEDWFASEKRRLGILPKPNKPSAPREDEYDPFADE